MTSGKALRNTPLHLRPPRSTPAGKGAARSVGTGAVIALTFSVGLITAIVFTPVLSAQALCFDDTLFLFDNQSFQQPAWKAAGQFLTEVIHSSTIEGYYEPLTLISLLLDVKAGGQRADLSAFHRTSLALHVANAMLVSILIYLLFGDPLIAALLGVLFGLHPLCVEPIAWVWERKTPLATFFALACLIGYVLYVQRRRPWLLIASATLMLLSLMSKPTSVMLAPCLILLDLWPLRRFSLRTLLEKTPFLLLTAVAAGVTIVSTAKNSFVTLPWEKSGGDSLLRVLYLPAFYFGKILWPVHLTPRYVLPEPFSWSNTMVLLAAVVTVAVMLGMLISWRWNRAPAVGGLMSFLLIAPTLGLVTYSWVVASDKYAYLPMVGLVLPLAWLMIRLRAAGSARCGPRRATAMVLSCGLALAAGEAWMTRAQISRWADTEALGRRVIDLAPGVSQGYVLASAGIHEPHRAQERIELLQQAARLAPTDSEIHVNLARVLSGMGRDMEALEQYRMAMADFPDGSDKARAYLELATSFAQKQAFEAAAAAYRESARLQPVAETWLNLGNALSNLKRPGEAIEAYREALRLQPGYARCHANLADALVKTSRIDEAIQHYRQAVAQEPGNAGYHVRLGAALEQNHQKNQAIQEYQQALNLNPRHADARRRLDAASTAPASSPSP